MTISEIIKAEVEAMSPAKQKKALELVRTLDSAHGTKGRRRRSVSMSRGRGLGYVPKDPALRAFAGMWKDRTDVAKDPIKAVKEIRARMWTRDNG